jgi:hypothetical protein
MGQEPTPRTGPAPRPRVSSLTFEQFLAIYPRMAGAEGGEGGGGGGEGIGLGVGGGGGGGGGEGGSGSQEGQGASSSRKTFDKSYVKQLRQGVGGLPHEGRRARNSPEGVRGPRQVGPREDRGRARHAQGPRRIGGGPAREVRGSRQGRTADRARPPHLRLDAEGDGRRRQAARGRPRRRQRRRWVRRRRTRRRRPAPGHGRAHPTRLRPHVAHGSPRHGRGGASYTTSPPKEDNPCPSASLTSWVRSRPPSRRPGTTSSPSCAPPVCRSTPTTT